MNISRIKGIATPKSIESVEDWIREQPESEQVSLRIAFGLGWNLLAATVEEVQEFGGDCYEHLEY